VISTHILDTTRSKPAAHVEVVLEVKEGSGWRQCGGGRTNEDGRLKPVTTETLQVASYRMSFAVQSYLQTHHGGGFYPEVAITFSVHDATEHFHVPLLLNPFGYSTYRGS